MAAAAPVRAADEPATAPAAAAQAEKEKLRRELQGKLDGTTWELELQLLGADKKKAMRDTLTFEGRTVTSQRLSKRGYGATNYSVNVIDPGIAVWETMQSNPQEGLVFLRGELKGDVMEGLINEQPSGGTPKEYVFAGKKQAGGPKPAEAEAPEVAPAQPVPPPAAPEAPPAASTTPAMPQPEAAVTAPEPAPAPAMSQETPPAPTPEPPKKKKKGWLW